MKTYAGYKAIKSGNGRSVYVRQESYGLFVQVLKEYQRNYHFTTILRTIQLLNADGQRGMSLNAAGDAKAIQSGNIFMRYQIFDGAVFIQVLALTSTETPEKTGLYSVEYNKRLETWLPQKKSIENLSKTRKWQSDNGTAVYAAVAGRFDKLNSASRMMPQHLKGGYQKANLLTKSGAGTEYSLFWCEKGSHKSEASAQSLASIMQQSAKNNLPVNWLIHGEGVHTLTKAAKILKTSPLASASVTSKNADAEKIPQQNVYFSNPASSAGENALKTLCKQAGLTYLGLNTSNRDLKRWSTVKHVGREMSMHLSSAALAGGGVYAVGSSAVTKGLGASDLGKAMGSVINGFTHGDYAVIAAGTVAAGVAVTSAIKKSKAIAAGVRCTFGRGNDLWYSDDKALLS